MAGRESTIPVKALFTHSQWGGADCQRRLLTLQITAQNIDNWQNVWIEFWKRFPWHVLQHIMNCWRCGEGTRAVCIEPLRCERGAQTMRSLSWNCWKVDYTHTQLYILLHIYAHTYNNKQIGMRENVLFAAWSAISFGNFVGLRVHFSLNRCELAAFLRLAHCFRSFILGFWFDAPLTGKFLIWFGLIWFARVVQWAHTYSYA